MRKIKRSILHRFINGLIIAFACLVSSLLVFIAFSQTHTFRTFLKKQIVETVNENLNGKIRIGKLDGSILSSLILNNVFIYDNEGDEVFFSKTIALKISPHKLIFDIIYAREIEIKNLRIFNKQDYNGNWTFETLFKPSSDSTSEDSMFPYRIEVAKISLSDLNYKAKNFYTGKETNKNIFDVNRFELQHFNMTASAVIDIPESFYSILIDNSSFSINNNKNIKKFSSLIEVTKNKVILNKFSLVSDSTDIELDFVFDNFSLFDSLSVSSFAKSPFKINLNAKQFNFNDFYYFTGFDRFLNGTPSFVLDVEGVLRKMRVNKLEIGYLNSYLDINGEILHMDNPSKMNLNLNAVNSQIYYDDLPVLMPSTNFQKFTDLNLEKLNIKFLGQYNKFKSSLTSVINGGSLAIESFLNFEQNKFDYDVVLNTKNLNLAPLIKSQTNLNSEMSLKGSGFLINDMNSLISIKSSNSSFENIFVDSIYLNMNIDKGQLNFNSFSKIFGSKSNIKGDLNFTDSLHIPMSVKGNIRHLNLYSLTKDTSFVSDLNLSFSIDTKDIKFENSQSILSVKFDKSYMLDREIENKEFDVVFNFTNAENKSFGFISDFLTMNLTGKFSFQDFFPLLAYQANTMKNAIYQKASRLNPLVESKIKNLDFMAPTDTIFHTFIDTEFNLKILDNEIIKFLTGAEKFDIKADLAGRMYNDSLSFKSDFNLTIDNLTLINNNKPFYISELDAEFNVSRNNLSLGFNDIFSVLNIETKRIFSGTEISNLSLDMVFNENRLLLSSSTQVDSLLFLELDGELFMSSLSQQIKLNNFSLSYKNSEWQNKDTIDLVFTKDLFLINKFDLNSDSTSVIIKGALSDYSNMDFYTEINNLNNKTLSLFFQLFNDPDLLFNSNITGKCYGTLTSPVFDLKFLSKNILYQNINVGILNGNINYDDELLNIQFFLMDQNKVNNNKFRFAALLPMNLAVLTEQPRFPNDKKIQIDIESNDFLINSIGSSIPAIKINSGELNSDIRIEGTYDDIKYSGTASLVDGNFTFNFNNINYLTDLNLEFNGKSARFTDLNIKNSGDTKYNGSLTGNGKILFDGFAPATIDLFFKGDIAFLGQKTKIVNPIFYGDMLIATEDSVRYLYKDSKSLLDGTIILKNTDVVYTYKLDKEIQNSNDFVYNFVADSSKFDKEEVRFKNLLKTLKKSISHSDQQNSYASKFDYNFNFKIDNDARMVILFPDMINQKLTIEAIGGFSYSYLDGSLRSQGYISLLPGSTLDFYKKFDAAGTLKFESDITDPYLNISAVYQGEYSSPKDNSTEPVAVKIKILGPLSDLGKILTSKNDNISVFRGEKNIKNSISDNRYDFSDAIIFLITNKFKDDLTQTDQNEITKEVSSSMAISLAGTFLSDFVSSSMGGVINNIQVTEDYRASRNSYLYNLSGRYKNFKYSFGASTQYAIKTNLINFRFEYLFSPNFSSRLEQKNPIGYKFDEKMLELGLKLNLEF